MSNASALNPNLTHQQPAHLWDYWATVMKRLWLVVLVAIASLVVAHLVTENQEPTYRATAVVKIVPPVSSNNALFASPILTDPRLLETLIDELRMPATIERAVRTQKLAQNRDFHGKSEGDIVRLASGKVDVSVRRNRLMLDVAVTGNDPKVLPHLANAIVREFQDMQRSESRARRETARAELEAKITRLQSHAKLAATDKRINLDSKKYTEQTFEYEYALHRERLREYTFHRDSVMREISRGRTLYEVFRAAREKPQGTAVETFGQIAEIRQDPEYRAYEEDVADLKARLAALRKEGYGSNNETYRRIEEQISDLMRQWNRMVDAKVDAKMVEFQGLERQLADDNSELHAIRAKVEEVVNLKGYVDQKNEEIADAKEEIAALQKQLDPILATAWDDRDTVQIVDSAREPTEPFSPNRQANMTLGAVIGLVGGIALCFVLDYLDDTIRTKDELAKIADVPLLGVVPNIAGRGSDVAKRDLYAHYQPKSTISEAYRGVRTALTLSAEGPHQKVLLLTSAGPREGKSTTAINLATVLAYSGGRTLVIDADLRKPRLHKSFGVLNTRGLTNLIIGNDDPASVCQHTSVERVDVLPSGPIPPNPSELLGHPKMRAIVSRLRETYDHVLIDTPPIGAVTDAAVLATIADGVILVVHAGKTRRQIVSRGIEQLRYINARIVGVILNNLRVSRIRYYPGYYHYYYYYSSHYGAEEAPPAAAKAAVRAPADDAEGAAKD